MQTQKKSIKTKAGNSENLEILGKWWEAGYMWHGGRSQDEVDQRDWNQIYLFNKYFFGVYCMQGALASTCERSWLSPCKEDRGRGTFNKESDIIRLIWEGCNSRSGMEDFLEWEDTEREANEEAIINNSEINAPWIPDDPIWRGHQGSILGSWRTAP